VLRTEFFLPCSPPLGAGLFWPSVPCWQKQTRLKKRKQKNSGDYFDAATGTRFRPVENHLLTLSQESDLYVIG